MTSGNLKVAARIFIWLQLANIILYAKRQVTLR